MNRILVVLLSLLAAMQVHAQQQTQRITGYIYDEASRVPLTGVIVTVLNITPARGAATDENGRFSIDSVTIGRRSLKISYISYEAKVINDVVVTAGKEVNLDIALQEAVVNMNEVTISYDRGKDKNRTINDMALISARSFNVDETKKYAGALGDPSRMAANFAGIVAGNDSRNDIVVRGNSPTGMLWQIEGLNAPNPNHFGTITSTGGPVSMLNNNNIAKSDFLTGAFPAQYGNALAGAFDIKLRNGNRDKAEYVAQIGFNGFEGGAEGPIGKNKKTSYLINYRYSTLSVFKELGLNLGTGTAVPVYQDVNYKVVSDLSKKSKLSVFGIAGNSRADFLGKDIDTTKPDLYGGNPFSDQKTKFGTTITGVSFEHLLSEKSTTKLIVGYSTTDQLYTNDSISQSDYTTHPSELADFSTGKLSVQWLYMYKFNSKNNLQTGLTYENISYDMNYKRMYPQQPDRVYADQSGNMGLYQGFAQWKHRFSKDLSVVGGMHFQYLDLNNSFVAEPRAGMRYTINTRNAVSLGYGLHSQAQNVYNYLVRTPNATGGYALTNKNMDFTQSNHFVASYDLNLSSSMRIKAETFYQLIGNVPIESSASSFSVLNSGADFGLDNRDSLVNKGKGYNYGAELTVEHFLSKGFYFLITGSLIRSRYEGSDGVERNTAFNTGHVLNVLAGKEFKVGKKGSVLAVNVKATTIGGRYLTPLNLAASQLSGSAVYRTELAFSEKQPDYFRTDFKVAYRKEFRKSTMEFSVDLQNVTNNKNVFNQTYDRRTNRIVNNYQQGFFPVPMFRYTF